MFFSNGKLYTSRLDAPKDASEVPTYDLGDGRFLVLAVPGPLVPDNDPEVIVRQKIRESAQGMLTREQREALNIPTDKDLEEQRVEAEARAVEEASIREEAERAAIKAADETRAKVLESRRVRLLAGLKK